MNQEPVARIIDIELMRGVEIVRNYVRGQFMPVSNDKNMVGPVQNVAAVVIRFAGKAHASVAHVEQQLCVGDIIKTGPDTIMAIEFLIGGRASINNSTCVEVINERSISDTSVSEWARLFKPGPKALKQPLEIQTNGGTMGIKG